MPLTPSKPKEAATGPHRGADESRTEANPPPFRDPACSGKPTDARERPAGWPRRSAPKEAPPRGRGWLPTPARTGGTAPYATSLRAFSRERIGSASGPSCLLSKPRTPREVTASPLRKLLAPTGGPPWRPLSAFASSQVSVLRRAACPPPPKRIYTKFKGADSPHKCAWIVV